MFHAAALKHLPLLEAYPVEALKTNVWGTLAVLDAAAASGVDRFVNISTDKAANPCSMLGYSKRVAEGLTAGVDERARGRFISRPLRQRARQPRFGAHHVPDAARAGWPAHGHAPRRRPGSS